MKGEKIVNVGMNIALILALALAATGSSIKYQVDVSNSNSAVRGHNLNHNETLVRDNGFKTVGPTNCPKWLCGGNHNETLVRDAATPQRADDWSLWLSGVQTFALASLLSQFSTYRAGPGCSKWVCGTNHNETLMRDTSQSQQSDTWNFLMSRAQSFAASSLLIQFSIYRPGSCSHWHCNHNETLVPDAAR